MFPTSFKSCCVNRLGFQLFQHGQAFSPFSTCSTTTSTVSTCSPIKILDINTFQTHTISKTTPFCYLITSWHTLALCQWAKRPHNKTGGGEICKAKAAVPASPPSSNKGRGKAKRKLNIVAADESRQQFSPEETGVAGEMTAVADNIERLGIVTLESKWRTLFLREGQPRVAKDSYVFKERPLVVVRYEEEPAL